MSVTRNSSAYGHGFERLGEDWYRLSWCIDFKYAGSRLRHPRRFRRDTDHAGAVRFAKKWGIAAPIRQPA